MSKFDDFMKLMNQYMSLNPHHAMQLKNHRLKHEHYLPEFMKRLEGYIYKEAYAVTEDVFEHTFLRDFAF